MLDRDDCIAFNEIRCKSWTITGKSATITKEKVKMNESGHSVFWFLTSLLSSHVCAAWEAQLCHYSSGTVTLVKQQAHEWKQSYWATHEAARWGYATVKGSHGVLCLCTPYAFNMLDTLRVTCSTCSVAMSVLHVQHLIKAINVLMTWFCVVITVCCSLLIPATHSIYLHYLTVFRMMS